jgi:hypothetical protein
MAFPAIPDILNIPLVQRSAHVDGWRDEPQRAAKHGVMTLRPQCRFR